MSSYTISCVLICVVNIVYVTWHSAFSQLTTITYLLRLISIIHLYIDWSYYDSSVGRYRYIYTTKSNSIEDLPRHTYVIGAALFVLFRSAFLRGKCGVGSGRWKVEGGRWRGWKKQAATGSRSGGITNNNSSSTNVACNNSNCKQWY
jgi:hypothetical protein